MYNNSNLSVLSYSNGFTLWHYTTTDTAATVDTTGYFDGAADMLRSGDMILANLDTNHAPSATIYLVGGRVGGVSVVSLTYAPAAD